MDTGYIDLSKRRVSPEDITKCEERYMKSKTVASIMRHVASKIPATGDPTSPVDAPAAEEPKKSRRARKEAQEDDAIVLVDDAGTGGANEEERLEMLYDTIAWPLGKTYGHPYDAYKLALTYVPLSPPTALLHRLLTSYLPQRTNNRLFKPRHSPTSEHPHHSPVNYRPPTHTTAHQAPRRYRADLLHPFRD